MGYYMRYISTDSTETTMPVLQQALKERDPEYSITESGEVRRGNEIYGAVEINLPGDGLFDEEIEELKECVEEVRGKRKADVIKTLDSAKAIVAVQVLFGDRQAEAAIRKLDPLFEWLIVNRKGLLQVDDEGYYDQTGLVLKVQ